MSTIEVKLQIEDSLYYKLETLGRLSGLGIHGLIKEALWRESSNQKRFVSECEEIKYIDWWTKPS